MTQPLLEFKSHIDGQNADVAIYDDRIEWSRAGRFGVGKAGLAVATGGLSLAAKAGRTGSRGAGTEVIPMRNISSVTTKKDGLRFWAVSVTTTGNTIDFRVTKEEADQARALIQQQILAAPTVVVQQPAASPAPSADDSVEQLKRLAELRDSGILTDDEFTAKKAQILGL